MANIQWYIENKSQAAGGYDFATLQPGDRVVVADSKSIAGIYRYLGVVDWNNGERIKLENGYLFCALTGFELAPSGYFDTPPRHDNRRWLESPNAQPFQDWTEKELPEYSSY